jgi:hypothetical protein
LAQRSALNSWRSFWFAFDWGPVHFTILSSEARPDLSLASPLRVPPSYLPQDDYSPGSPQYTVLSLFASCVARFHVRD